MASDSGSDQYWGKDDASWNDIFCLRDEEDNKGIIDSDSEDEDGVGVGHIPSVPVAPAEVESHPTQERTHSLRERWKTYNLADRIRKGLEYLGQLGLNLELLLDGISWGDSECTQDPVIRNARTSLLHSKELPSILHRWHRPPRNPDSHNRRARGVKDVMEAFAIECTWEIRHEEIEGIKDIMSSPAGKDIEEETLMGLKFDELIKEIKTHAPVMWKDIWDLAYSPAQEKRNKKKNPDKVC